MLWNWFDVGGKEKIKYMKFDIEQFHGDFEYTNIFRYYYIYIYTFSIKGSAWTVYVSYSPFDEFWIKKYPIFHDPREREEVKK